MHFSTSGLRVLVGRMEKADLRIEDKKSVPAGGVEDPLGEGQSEGTGATTRVDASVDGGASGRTWGKIWRSALLWLALGACSQSTAVSDASLDAPVDPDWDGGALWDAPRDGLPDGLVIDGASENDGSIGRQVGGWTMTAGPVPLRAERDGLAAAEYGEVRTLVDEDTVHLAFVAEWNGEPEGSASLMFTRDRPFEGAWAAASFFSQPLHPVRGEAEGPRHATVWWPEVSEYEFVVVDSEGVTAPIRLRQGHPPPSASAYWGESRPIDVRAVNERVWFLLAEEVGRFQVRSEGRRAVHFCGRTAALTHTGSVEGSEPAVIGLGLQPCEGGEGEMTRVSRLPVHIEGLDWSGAASFRVSSRASSLQVASAEGGDWLVVSHWAGQYLEVYFWPHRASPELVMHVELQQVEFQVTSLAAVGERLLLGVLGLDDWENPMVDLVAIDRQGLERHQRLEDLGEIKAIAASVVSSSVVVVSGEFGRRYVTRWAPTEGDGDVWP